MSESILHLETELDLLKIKDGDTVILRYDPEIHPHPEVIAGQRLRDYLKGIGIDCVVLVLPFGMDLEAVDEQEMELYGWVRPERRAYKNRRKKDPSAPAKGTIPGPSVPGLQT